MSDDWQVVEEALRDEGARRTKDARSAIARLREREAQLERERDQACVRRDVEKARVAQLEDACALLNGSLDHYVPLGNRAEAAEARVAELEQIGRRMVEQVDELTEGRIERNARAARLEEAAREVLDYENAPSRSSLSKLRSALAHEEEA